MGVQNAIITLGSLGAVYVSNQEDTGKHFPPPYLSEKVIDTVGAGDVFNGAFSTALAENAPIYNRKWKKNDPEAVHIYTGESTVLRCDALVLVTARIPNSSLEYELEKVSNSWDIAGLKSVTRIGDALAPSTIAAAVYSGHRYARELDEEVDPDLVPFDRELTQMAPEPDWKKFWE